MAHTCMQRIWGSRSRKCTKPHPLPRPVVLSLNTRTCVRVRIAEMSVCHKKTTIE